METGGSKCKFLIVFIVNAIMILSISVLTPRYAYALAFTPTESEWLSWPDYCRARYVVSGAGVGSSFKQRVSSTEVTMQELRMGEEAWYWLHHYCAAIAYLSRAEATQDTDRKNFWLGEADGNAIGHYQRIKRKNPMFPDTVITLAKMEKMRGNTSAALTYLEEAMEAHPTSTSPYAFSAIIYKDLGDLDKAVEVLVRGNKAASGNSAELHYFLGLMYVEKNNLELAKKHAAYAYELGYPLPGLKAKLRRRGVELP